MLLNVFQLLHFPVISQFFYMTKFYLSSVTVDVTMPLLAAWSDDLIKRRLSAEIATFGGYGHVHVRSNCTLLSL